MKQRLLFITVLLSSSLYPAHVALTAVDKADFVSTRLTLKKDRLTEKKAYLLRLEGNLLLTPNAEAIELIQSKITRLNNEIMVLLQEIPILELSLKALGTLSTNGK